MKRHTTVSVFIVHSNFDFFLAFLQPVQHDISRLQPRGGHHPAAAGWRMGVAGRMNSWASVFKKFV
jgi:hypothetical protein